jgi:formamidopyrimidine-DNA glycosylase
MPELPEVQTVINALNKSNIIDAKIIKTKVYVPKMLKNSSINVFNKFLIGEKIKHIDRLGKYLVFKLTNNKICLMHLRMEGKIFVEKANSDPRKYLCVEISSSNSVLRFYDFRKFGTIHIYSNEKEFNNSIPVSKVGIDPLNSKFNGQFLFDKLSKSNKYIKTALLDQSKVSGIGNIYADEILFRSRISPLRKANKVSKLEFNKIAKEATSVMKSSIKNGGTTISTFESSNHKIGSFQSKLLMYGKKVCPVCGKPTVSIKVNGRGTHYCKYCQK